MSDSDFVDPDDLKVQRNGDGEVIPQTEELGTLGKLKVKPMTYGDVEEEFGDGSTSELSPKDMAFIFNTWILKPSFDYSGKDVEDMKPMVPGRMLELVMDVSGIEAEVEVDDDGRATVEVGNT